MVAVQGRDGLQGGSVRPQLPQGFSITRPREGPQNTSPMQEWKHELETYLSENFSTLQQILSDTTDRDEAFHKSFESTLTSLAELVAKLNDKVESFYKIMESQAFPAPEGLDADGVDLGDMTNLVNF
ncbi:hypothetical protein HER10_EVM0000499 [Colletotrichum scovillei]|uniref:uncharacterized protein n=1 Tax=Colletotrichum scovillei TaxID=1209932 RepID=UPI0015C3866B|nr:uncharacterized protein HER10_EVM0000499 [Colletotrichum scovillei]KAF4772690.1 hypothetical protein HER10_EVM0000499 [Colletotrichum scovillei]